MAAKHQLRYGLLTLLNHNKDGSFETRASRKKILLQAANTLSEHGFKLSHLKGLKQKHIVFLNQHWQSQGISAATCKNRNSHLRWLAAKLNKLSMMPSNDALGIAKRQYTSHISKAIELSDAQIAKITNKHVLVSLHLQQHLGLRREEALKIKPHLADKGDYVMLQSSWCKGGRPRTIPVLTKEARHWLEQAKQLAPTKNSSLIPSEQSYIAHRRIYDVQLQQAKIFKAHGLRHAYAQHRYKTLTGFECPARGGPDKKALTTAQQEQDTLARSIITEELGHSRLSITKIYIGK